MSFTNAQIVQTWNKATAVLGYDQNLYRVDQCGAWISWQEYGNRNSPYGWEIDHIQHLANNGSDSLSNLRPLQWENNLQRGDGKLSCPITRAGVSNIRR